ncbi:MAG: hypothetical protein EHM61_07815 [Acidobacteria bacterium]|nr:MAG: hypothetical protein EHM61_07815 [Acidobacteriota bacterium]
MHTAQALKKGLDDIRANKRVVLLLWLTNLILALALALPLLGWLDKLSDTSEADVMLEQFSLRLLVEIGYYDFSALWRLASRLFVWLILAASLVSTFMSGGVLTVLANPSEEPLLERFFAGAGRYFLRFLGLLVGVGTCAMVVLSGLNLLMGAIVAKVSESSSEVTPLILGLFQTVLSILVGSVFLLVLHYARIATVADGLSSIIKAVLRSLAFVFRNFLRTFALLIFFAAAGGLVYLAYWMIRGVLPTTSWLLILALIAVQQAVTVARSALQLGLVGAEMQLYVLRRPKVEKISGEPERQPELMAEVADPEPGTEGTQGTQGTEGTEETQGTLG